MPECRAGSCHVFRREPATFGWTTARSHAAGNLRSRLPIARHPW